MLRASLAMERGGNILALAEQTPQRIQCSAGLLTTSSLQNSLPSLLSHSEGAHRHLRDIKDPDIVGDGPNTDSNLVSVASLLHIAGQSGDGERRPVDLGHEESPQDDLVELGLGPPGQ